MHNWCRCVVLAAGQTHKGLAAVQCRQNMEMQMEEPGQVAEARLSWWTDNEGWFLWLVIGMWWPTVLVKEGDSNEGCLLEFHYFGNEH